MATPEPVVISQRSETIFRLKRMYVGKLREQPPPRDIQEKWRKDILAKLATDLAQAVKQMSASLPDHKLIIDPVLVMAGEAIVLNKKQAVNPGQYPPDPVLLKPTVWIYCGSKRCKKKVEHWIKKLPYLNTFLRNYDMGPPNPILSLDAPYPAAGDIQMFTGDVLEVSFAIERPQSDTICGAKGRFTAQAGGMKFERYFTIGGLIIVGDKTYALTTGHGFMECIREATEAYQNDGVIHSDRATLTNGEISSSTSHESDNSEGDSQSDSETDSSSSGKRASQSQVLPIQDGNRENGVSHDQQNAISWLEMDLPSIVAYAGKGTRSQNYRFQDLAPAQSDFALIDVASLGKLTNTFSSRDGWWPPPVSVISDIILNVDLTAGEVTIITSWSESSLQCYLLEEESVLVLGGTVIQTRRIQISGHQNFGISGSWVVRGNKLCGVIFAAFNRSPYLHMIPAEDILRRHIPDFVGLEAKVGHFQPLPRTNTVVPFQFRNGEDLSAEQAGFFSSAIPDEPTENAKSVQNEAMLPPAPSDEVAAHSISKENVSQKPTEKPAEKSTEKSTQKPTVATCEDYDTDNSEPVRDTIRHAKIGPGATSTLPKRKPPKAVGPKRIKVDDFKTQRTIPPLSESAVTTDSEPESEDEDGWEPVDSDMEPYHATRRARRPYPYRKSTIRNRSGYLGSRRSKAAIAKVDHIYAKMQLKIADQLFKSEYGESDDDAYYDVLHTEYNVLKKERKRLKGQAGDNDRDGSTKEKDAEIRRLQRENERVKNRESALRDEIYLLETQLDDLRESSMIQLKEERQKNDERSQTDEEAKYVLTRLEAISAESSKIIEETGGSNPADLDGRFYAMQKQIEELIAELKKKEEARKQEDAEKGFRTEMKERLLQAGLSHYEIEGIMERGAARPIAAEVRSPPLPPRSPSPPVRLETRGGYGLPSQQSNPFAPPQQFPPYVPYPGYPGYPPIPTFLPPGGHVLPTPNQSPYPYQHNPFTPASSREVTKKIFK